MTAHAPKPDGGSARTRRRVSVALAAIAVVASAGVAVAATKRISPVSWGWYGQVRAPAGVAIDGYDPVAYHAASNATAGSKEHVVEWHGVRWLFSNQENRALFEGDPEHYAPAFGGFCAFAASKGFTAKTDPGVWQVEGGRLYLFNDAGMRENWRAELENGVIERGHQAWATRPVTSE